MDNKQHNIITAEPVCAVCGTVAAAPQWAVSDTLLGRPERYRIVRCSECGTLRMQPRPAFSDRRQSFSDDYPLFDWALGRKEIIAPQRMAKFRAQIGQICRRQKPGSLLDVGCGDGFFMLGMQERGWQVKGIEINARVAEFCRQSLALEVIAGAESEVEWGGPYDCITLLGVIEDLDDPAACLKRCYENLTTGGLLLVQTHNIESCEARRFGPDWFNVDAPRHVWHFAPDTLKRLLEGHGFRQEVLLHYGSSYVTERSLENRRGRPFPSSAADRLLAKAVVAPAAKLAPRLHQGIMIEAYCRKV